MSKIQGKKWLGQSVRDQCKPVSYSDVGGEYFNTEDMVKQMEYRGQSLVWNGLMVGKDYYDPPNPQNKSFEPKKETIDFTNMRLDPNDPQIAPLPLLTLEQIWEQEAAVNNSDNPLGNNNQPVGVVALNNENNAGFEEE